MNLPQRKPNRLKNYDYSKNGAYFITVCVKNRQNLLWNVGAVYDRLNKDNKYLSKYGLIIKNEIQKIPTVYKSIFINKYVIMPNHIHMIILINNDIICDNGRPKVTPTISRIIQQFKGSVTKQTGFCIWQKSFHDRIVRNEKEYLKIWQYIDTNPMK